MRTDLRVLCIAFALIVFGGCMERQNAGNLEGRQNMALADTKTGNASFTTTDGFVIHGNLWRGGKKAVLLMHQFQLDKSSFTGLAQELNTANFTVLAIDLRGHGESVMQNGKKRPFQAFSEQDFRNMELDARAAKQFLEKEGFALYAVVGSSIGANTALNFAAAYSGIEKAVLLSPGLNFKGIETEKNAGKVKAGVLIVASSEDTYSFSSGKALAETIPDAKMRELRNAGHGTWMLSGTGLLEEITRWLSAGN